MSTSGVNTNPRPSGQSMNQASDDPRTSIRNIQLMPNIQTNPNITAEDRIVLLSKDNYLAQDLLTKYYKDINSSNFSATFLTGCENPYIIKAVINQVQQNKASQYVENLAKDKAMGIQLLGWQQVIVDQQGKMKLNDYLVSVDKYFDRFDLNKNFEETDSKLGLSIQRNGREYILQGLNPTNGITETTLEDIEMLNQEYVYSHFDAKRTDGLAKGAFKAFVTKPMKLLFDSSRMEPERLIFLDTNQTIFEVAKGNCTFSVNCLKGLYFISTLLRKWFNSQNHNCGINDSEIHNKIKELELKIGKHQGDLLSDEDLNLYQTEFTYENYFRYNPDEVVRFIQDSNDEQKNKLLTDAKKYLDILNFVVTEYYNHQLSRFHKSMNIAIRCVAWAYSTTITEKNSVSKKLTSGLAKQVNSYGMHTIYDVLTGYFGGQLGNNNIDFYYKLYLDGFTDFDVNCAMSTSSFMKNSKMVTTLKNMLPDNIINNDSLGIETKALYMTLDMVIYCRVNYNLKPLNKANNTDRDFNGFVKDFTNQFMFYITKGDPQYIKVYTMILNILLPLAFYTTSQQYLKMSVGLIYDFSKICPSPNNLCVFKRDLVVKVILNLLTIDWFRELSIQKLDKKTKYYRTKEMLVEKGERRTQEESHLLNDHYQDNWDYKELYRALGLSDQFINNVLSPSEWKELKARNLEEYNIKVKLVQEEYEKWKPEHANLNRFVRAAEKYHLDKESFRMGINSEYKLDIENSIKELSDEFITEACRQNGLLPLKDKTFTYDNCSVSENNDEGIDSSDNYKVIGIEEVGPTKFVRIEHKTTHDTKAIHVQGQRRNRKKGNQTRNHMIYEQNWQNHINTAARIFSTDEQNQQRDNIQNNSNNQNGGNPPPGSGPSGSGNPPSADQGSASKPSDQGSSSHHQQQSAGGNKPAMDQNLGGGNHSGNFRQPKDFKDLTYDELLIHVDLYTRSRLQLFQRMNLVYKNYLENGHKQMTRLAQFCSQNGDLLQQNNINEKLLLIKKSPSPKPSGSGTPKPESENPRTSEEPKKPKGKEPESDVFRQPEDTKPKEPNESPSNQDSTESTKPQRTEEDGTKNNATNPIELNDSDKKDLEEIETLKDDRQIINRVSKFLSTKGESRLSYYNSFSNKIIETINKLKMRVIVMIFNVILPELSRFCKEEFINYKHAANELKINGNDPDCLYNLMFEYAHDLNNITKSKQVLEIICKHIDLNKVNEKHKVFIEILKEDQKQIEEMISIREKLTESDLWYQEYLKTLTLNGKPTLTKTSVMHSKWYEERSQDQGLKDYITQEFNNQKNQIKPLEALKTDIGSILIMS